MTTPRPPREKKAAPRAADELRREAEERLDALAAASPSLSVPKELTAAIHELRVHQIELEMQNEELRRVQLELQAQREKYFALFEQAPVGYLTLDDRGIVGAANLTAAYLLSVERPLLVGRPFTAFVSAPDQDAYYLYFHRLTKTHEPQTCELRLQRVDAEPFWAHLEGRPQGGAFGEPQRYHLTFTDVPERALAEEALRRRVAELDALQRISRTLADRVELATALDQAALEIAGLLSAEHASIDLAGAPDAAAADGSKAPPANNGSMDRRLIVPLMARGTTIGALSVARDLGAPFSAADRRLAETVAYDVAAAVENERLHEQETRDATDEERRRLARDLHDSVTQTIYSAALIAEALPAVWEREPDAGRSSLVRLRRLVRGALAELRMLLFELRPEALDAAPLDALLDRLGDALAGQIQVPVTIRAAGDLVLPSAAKLVFFRVTQEAFSNIAKHAGATAVAVDVAADGDGAVSLCVRDDGRGFDPRRVAADGMGLRIMRERLDGVGASLAIDSEPGCGVTLTAIWPGPSRGSASGGWGA
jgi:PAS domain S-box-containing protein